MTFTDLISIILLEAVTKKALFKYQFVEQDSNKSEIQGT